MSGPALELLDVSVAFHAGPPGRAEAPLCALRDVNLRVAAGEVVCVLGPSGCGKTTLLNVAAGFLAPSAGRARAGGRPIAGPGPDRGVVFQTDALFPWLSVRRNIEFGPRCRDDAARLRQVGEYIGLVGLRGFEDFLPGRLSGGMRQRAALARALINHAGLLLLDEPFGSLDAQTRETMQELLLAVHARLAPAAVFVTHDIGEALFLGDRVLLMGPRPGTVLEDLAVPLPRPRTPDMRDVPELAGLHRHLRHRLRADAGAAGCLSRV